MSINIEQIDLLRKRANVSYEEAKKALENNNNDLVEALIYLEQNQKTKFNSNSSTFKVKLKSLLKKSIDHKFLLYKESEVIVKLPLLIFVPLVICTAPISIIALVVALISGLKIKFTKKDSEIDFNGMISKINTAFDSTEKPVN
ncbi:DUF4342 domain-containing protein [Clostridium grantii]|uniref:DUF4342 domain-containing protein n=1 Tax=Clostridium grantii DSM 8605 TaxID=1121316 RepID=A0A1M5XJX6_9CLOT|nr:DUF4342 domain-containing protein [Clostridium grantii]SHI00111.1 protein of unknown function [Clostridium grantii DSM 8605]